MPILEGILEVVLQPFFHAVLTVPGGFIRWSISRIWKSEKSLKEYIREYALLNGLISILMFFAIGYILINWT